jgi:hypothetical protein
LTEGYTYAFKVQARNSVDLGDLSTEISILAAQIPDQPSAPTTTIDGSDAIVTWDFPDIRGSPITAYTITLRESDDLTFTTSLVTCDGTQTDIVDTRTCTIPVATLVTSPFSLAWGSSIYAIISATNIYGTSIDSA